MNWIKVSTGLLRDAKIGAIAEACRCDIPHAAGMVLGVLVTLPFEAPDGAVSNVSDTTLEAWAMWSGKRGKFAAAFREHLCTDGIVTAWERWNGSTKREFERKRDASKAWREARKNPERSGYGDDTVSAPYPPKRVEGRSNYGNYEQREEDTPCPPPPVFTEAVAWVAPRGHDALARLLSAVSEPSVWVGILRGYASGLSMDQGKPCDPERLAVAIEDFVAKGKHREQNGPSPSLFRAFVKAAKAPIRRYANQLTEAEEKAEQLLIIRQNNERKRRTGRPLVPEPAWAAEVDAMFPDGRTFPSGVAA